MPAEPPAAAWRTQLPFTPEHPQSRKIAAQLDSHDDVGVPLGGIGAGGINHGPSGGFNRWTVKAGQVDYLAHPAGGFALWQQPQDGPATARALRPAHPDLEGWHCDPTGDYAALYPKAWHSYTEGALSLTIEQLSPIAPQLTDDLDLPTGLFRAHLCNTGDTPLQAAILFSFPNMVGWFNGFRGIGHPGGVAGQRNAELNTGSLTGIRMTRDTAGPPDEGDGEMLIAAAHAPDLSITTTTAFDPARDGPKLWQHFAATGTAPHSDPWTSGGGFSEFPCAQPCAALSAKCTLQPGEARIIDLCLTWDLPVIRFGQGRRWHRHYTAKWGTDGTNAAAIATHALQNADHWSRAIDAFHAENLPRLNLPSQTAALPFNELYMLTDGLTVWTAPTPDLPAHFGLIECPDYPLYNTLDLWVYAATAVADLFPDIAASVVTDYATEVAKDDPEPRLHLKSAARFPRQRNDMLPHDLGAPAADPFARANDYTYQDSARWKDLNVMFALTAWRSARTSAHLAKQWLAPVTQAMQALEQFDRDGDGMIENEGFPDQTFDNVPLNGISAYCGGLWLAALRATAALAEKAGGNPVHWRALSAKAEQAFDKALWTGTHFRVDSHGQFQNAIFAEQMYGPATARMLGLGDTIDPEKARTALTTVYQKNFVEAGQSRALVAITSPSQSSTLYAPKGEEGLQWDEILIGFNYSFAAQLRTYGLEDECHTLLTALARELGPVRGLHFRTPAALHPTKPIYRAQMNLRPMGAWALALASETVC